MSGAIYPDGVTETHHIAHDMRVGRFPARSTVEEFLRERGAGPDLREMMAIAINAKRYTRCGQTPIALDNDRNDSTYARDLADAALHAITTTGQQPEPDTTMLHAALKTERLRTRATRESLQLAQGRADTLTADLAAARELLRQAAAQFREYERHHCAKSPPDTEKAARNAALAERIESHLGQAARTQGPAGRLLDGREHIEFPA